MAEEVGNLEISESGYEDKEDEVEDSHQTSPNKADEVREANLVKDNELSISQKKDDWREEGSLGSESGVTVLIPIAPPPVVVPKTEEPKWESLEFEEKLKAIFSDGAAKPTKQTKINRPKLIFRNTYQLEPAKLFSRTQVERCIERTLRESLTGMKYCSARASDVSCAMAEIIRNRVLEFGYDRYKIIVFVNVGPKARQGVEIGMKCVWDPVRDRYAHATFQSYHIFASAAVYGVYYD